MFLARFKRRSQIRRRKGERETLKEDAARFKDLVVSISRQRGLEIPSKLLKELQRATQQRDGNQRLYKLDIRHAHITDDHVEALAAALGELPVLRKLDLRNNAVTTTAVHALNTVLKAQLELFRMVQADASLADSSLSFLYSVKLDPFVLTEDRQGAAEMEAHMAALEVADAVLDVRYAFFEADVRSTGTLTEHELSGAMRAVVGSMPKPAETARILRFFGQRGSEGKDPALISLGGFEAAMAGRLREAHTLPVLTKGRDELLFGTTEKDGDEAFDCFSPWSTRSFRITGEAGVIEDINRGKRGSWPESPRALQRSAGTHVFSVPLWQDGEGDGTEMINTLVYGEAQDSDLHDKVRYSRLTRRASDTEGAGIRRRHSSRERANDRGEKGSANSVKHVGVVRGEVGKPSTNDSMAAGGAIAPKKESLAAHAFATTSGVDSRIPRDCRSALEVESPPCGEIPNVLTSRSAINAGDHTRLTGTTVVELDACDAESMSDNSSTQDSTNETDRAEVTQINIRNVAEEDHESPTLQMIHSQGERSVSSEARRSGFLRGETGRTSVETVVESAPDATSIGVVEGTEEEKEEGDATEIGAHFNERAEQRSECSSSYVGLADRRRTGDSLRGKSESPVVGRSASALDCGERRNELFDVAVPSAERGRLHSFEKHNDGKDLPGYQFAAGAPKQQTAGVPIHVGLTPSRSRRTAAHPANVIPALSEVYIESLIVKPPPTTTRTHVTNGTREGKGVDAEGGAPGSAPSTAGVISKGDVSALKTESITGVLKTTASTALPFSSQSERKDAAEQLLTAMPASTSLVRCPEESRSPPLSTNTTSGAHACSVNAATDGDVAATPQRSPEGGVIRPMPATATASPATASVLTEEGRDPGMTAARMAVGDGSSIAFAAPSVAGADNCGRISGSPQGRLPAGVGTPWFLAPEKVAARARVHPAANYVDRQRLAARIEFVSGLTAGPRNEVDETGRTLEDHRGRSSCTTDSNALVDLRIGSRSPDRQGLAHEVSGIDASGDGRRSGQGGHHRIPTPWSGGVGISIPLYAGGICNGSETRLLSRGSDSPTRAMVDGEMEARNPTSTAMGFLRPEEEEPLTVRIEESALILSRNGLSNMGIALDLEAAYGCGRDTLLALHTLVLSCNQLQVLESSVLIAMPALRHLDVSHNLLCRMEPMDGRNLPDRLETLNMSYNRISRIGGIGHCGGLRVLNLRHNRIKSALGLEHLSLLEQLDLGHNCILKAVSARALSFNRALKLLWLEGNPFAAEPRYRPTLTCLLPHVRAIDCKGVPPSNEWERRGQGDHGGIAVGPGRGSGGGVPKQIQEEQDDRRSNEWRQVVAWREEQAQLAIEHDEQNARDRRGLQATNPAQQRELVGELARPHPRARISKRAVNRAREIACLRSTIAFGATYRQGCSGTSIGRSRSTSPTHMQQKHQAMGRSERFHQSFTDGGQKVVLRHTGPTRYGSVDPDGTGDRVQYKHSSMHDIGGMTRVGVGVNNSFGMTDPSVSHYGPVDGPQRPDAVRFDDDMSRQGYRNPYHDEIAETFGKSFVAAPALQADGGAGVGTVETFDAVEVSQAEHSHGMRGESSLSSERKETLKEWHKDVAQETRTAATALKVLLQIHEERGKKLGGSRRLAGFRAALDGMGLFAEQYGPPPGFVGEEGIHADRALAAARRVATTKAAVKNMLRLMEAEPNGSPELDLYIEFVRQQEISSGFILHLTDSGRMPHMGVFAGPNDSVETDMHSAAAVRSADDERSESSVGAGNPMTRMESADQPLAGRGADRSGYEDGTVASRNCETREDSMGWHGSGQSADDGGLNTVTANPAEGARSNFSKKKDAQVEAIKSEPTVLNEPYLTVCTVTGDNQQELMNGGLSISKTGPSTEQNRVREHEEDLSDSDMRDRSTERNVVAVGSGGIGRESRTTCKGTSVSRPSFTKSLQQPSAALPMVASIAPELQLQATDTSKQLAADRVYPEFTASQGFARRTPTGHYVVDDARRPVAKGDPCAGPLEYSDAEGIDMAALDSTAATPEQLELDASVSNAQPGAAAPKAPETDVKADILSVARMESSTVEKTHTSEIQLVRTETSGTTRAVLDSTRQPAAAEFSSVAVASALFPEVLHDALTTDSPHDTGKHAAGVDTDHLNFAADSANEVPLAPLSVRERLLRHVRSQARDSGHASALENNNDSADIDEVEERTIEQAHNKRDLRVLETVDDSGDNEVQQSVERRNSMINGYSTPAGVRMSVTAPASVTLVDGIVPDEENKAKDSNHESRPASIEFPLGLSDAGIAVEMRNKGGGSVISPTSPPRTRLASSPGIESTPTNRVKNCKNGEDISDENEEADGLQRSPTEADEQYEAKNVQSEPLQTNSEAGKPVQTRDMAEEAGVKGYERSLPVDRNEPTLGAIERTLDDKQSDASKPLGVLTPASLGPKASGGNREAGRLSSGENLPGTTSKPISADSDVGDCGEPSVSADGMPLNTRTETSAAWSINLEEASNGVQGGEGVAVESKTAQDVSTGGDGDTASEEDNTEPEWIEGYDPNHDCYYYHHVATGESSWYKPDAPYESFIHSDEDEDAVRIDGATAKRSTTEPEVLPSTTKEKKHRRDEQVQRSRSDGFGDKQDNSSKTNESGARHNDRTASNVVGRSSGRARSTRVRHESARRSRSHSQLSYSSESRSGPEISDGRSDRKFGRSSERDRRRHRSRSPEHNPARAAHEGTKTGVVLDRRRSSDRSALERLSNLTDENISASDETASDDRRRSGGRRGRLYRDDEDCRRSNDRHRRGGSVNAVGGSGDGHEQVARSSSRNLFADKRGSRKRSSDFRRDTHLERRSSFSNGDGGYSEREKRANDRSRGHAGKGSHPRRASAESGHSTTVLSTTKSADRPKTVSRGLL